MTIELIVNWLLERLPKWLLLSALALGLFLVGAQAGRHKERALVAAELADLSRRAGAIEEDIAGLELMQEIIECESGGRHEGVWGDNGMSYGIAQFKENTFHELAAKAGMGGVEWTRKQDQLRLLRWSLANGYGGHWTCYAKIAGTASRQRGL